MIEQRGTLKGGSLSSKGTLKGGVLGVPSNVANTDHNNLKNRDVEDCHPISAITGLSDNLGTKLSISSSITNTEILEIMRS